MLSQLDSNFSRDRNLNINLSDAKSMQVLDNQGKDAKRNVTKFSSSQNKKEEAARKKEYDNYINTFTSGSGNRNDNNYKSTWQPPKMSSAPISAQDESSNTALNKPLKKTSSMESPGGKRLIRTPTQDKELRSAPAKPKSLVPPSQRLGSTAKLRHQGSSERTPTPTQSAHLKKIKSQTSDEEAERRKETALQRQILFDQIEEIEDRIEVFKADAKSETVSVQGAKKFEKIVNFNKQLRQFKKVHDRNKIICQESLSEKSDEEQNFIPEMPESKDLATRYKKFEKPKLVRKRSEKMLQEFHDKHKKLTAAFIQTSQMISDKAKSKSPPLNSTSTSPKDEDHQSSKDSQTSKRKNSMKMKDLEVAIFKSIESLNQGPNEEANKEDTKPDVETPKVGSINLLSTTINESFENILDTLPDTTDISTATNPIKGNIKQLIMKFDTPLSDGETKSEAEQKSDSDSESGKKDGLRKNGKDSLLSSKQKFLDVFTRTTPIFSSIDETWSPTNSMNQEVINFQEELLNFEADSLNPPDESTKGMSFNNSKAARRLSFDEMEADNFEKEKNKLKERNEKNNSDMTILKKSVNFFSRKLSEDKENIKIHNFGQSKTSPGKQEEKTLPAIPNGRAIENREKEVKADDEVKKLKPLFQNGFLNGPTKSREKETKEIIEKAIEAEETSPKVSITSEFKHRFLSSFSFEKSPPESLESSIFGSASQNPKKESVSSEKGDNVRKKSVHFEGDTVKKEKKEIEISPLGSYFPIIGSILSAGPSKPQVPVDEDSKKVPNGILVNLTTDRGSSRKESLESIETVDTVDLELIKLGLHKSSGDIRNQYLTKLHILSPPSSISPSVSPLQWSSTTVSITTSTLTTSKSHAAAATTTTTTSTSSASDQYTELLKNEEKITEENARLATKFEAQKSNFDPASKSSDVPSSSAPVTSTIAVSAAPSPPPFLSGPRARPPLRPMYMMGPGHMVSVRLRGGSPRMRYPPPPYMKASPPFLQRSDVGDLRMSPPPRMAMFRSPSPTHGLIRITPRHLPPSFRPPPLHLRPGSPPPHLRVRPPGASPGPGPPGPRASPPPGFRGSPPPMMRGSPPPRPALPPGFPPNALRSPRAPMMLRGSFSPLRPSQFSPNSPIRFRRAVPPGPHMRPGYYGGPRPRMWAAASAARFAVRHRMPTIASVDQTDKPSVSDKKQTTEEQMPGTSKETEKPQILDERAHLMKDLDTKIIVQNFDTRVKTKVPEMATLSCSDLLTAYRMTQSLNRNKPYKYDPADTMDLHRRLTINSRIIFDKLTSPRKEKKAPYVPNREIIRLFSTRTEEARTREALVLENEECLYNTKTSHAREGEFFQPKNPELIEKFQSTHEYIKKMYEHSKNNLIPPSDEFAEVHDRVKYFCGVTNEELLEKLKTVEERVMKSEWTGRISDAKEKMAKLYEENKEFLSKYKQKQEEKINNLLDENKELIENIKTKAESFDQMMERTVCDAI